MLRKKSKLSTYNEVNICKPLPLFGWGTTGGLELSKRCQWHSRFIITLQYGATELLIILRASSTVRVTLLNA